MTHRIDRNKWILYRHTSDFNLIVETAKAIKQFSKTDISVQEKQRLNLRHKEIGLYNERNPNLPLDAINHKINQLCFYMFGYKYKLNDTERFIFSPLGNLFLKYADDSIKRRLIFMSMLWSVQYEHPHSGTNSIFNLGLD